MSNYEPPGPDQEGGGTPSFDKQPPPPGAPFGTPSGESIPQNPYGSGNTPPQDPYGGQNPYGTPAPPYDPAAPYQAGYAPPGGGPAAGMPPIGNWLNRILARIIDFVLIQVIAVIIVLPFASLGDQSGLASANYVEVGLYLLYEGFMLSRGGQTLGKKAMKLRVAMLADGSSPQGSAAWTRAAVYTLPAVVCCGLWWLVNGLFGVFNKPYAQCLHDKAAKTVVVSTA